jgi:TolB-like protein/class 3 adenylate cyclase/Tfp pilus assembly protein PilF
VNLQDPPAEPVADLPLEIAHLLLIDIVGYSKLLVNEQIELLQKLKQVVRGTESFRTAEASGELIRVPTGDGMALVFFHSPEQPARCALELSQALQDHPSVRLRMGIHSGPISRVTDVNETTNIAGPGINVAQRVMDCGDAEHILVSAHVAEDLCQSRHWQPCLHDLGECEVKYGLRLHLFNLYKNGLGNPQVPEKLRRGRRRPASAISVRPITASRWPKPGLPIVFLVCALALVIGSLIFFNRTRPKTPARIARALSALAPIPAKSIAVLPFENLSDDKENAYFADGVQDEILTGLSRVADLKVISRTSVMQYKAGPRRNLREVATELRVAHVLEGTVQRAGGRVRVNAQLIDARTDSQLWAEGYDRDLADVFAIENELAEQIVSQLQAKLAPEEKAAIEKPPTTDFTAYDLYLRAKAILVTAAFNVGEKEKLFEGAQLLERAVAHDPQFLLAYYELARTHDRLYILGIDHTAARLDLAEAAIERALKLGPNSGEAHLALAAHLYTLLDYDRARQELAVAKRALPNEPLVFELTGYIDRRQGRWEECIRNLKRAQELDPRNFFNLQQIALAYEDMRYFPDAIASLDRALTLVPKDPGTRAQRAVANLEWRADTNPLHKVIRKIIGEDPSAAGGIADRWLCLALCERDHDAAINALAVMTGDGCRNEGVPLPRTWCEGVAARARGDDLAARAAFTSARVQIEKIVLAQPDYAEALCVLGLVDAGLGRKEEAIREGRRAVELLPVTKDAINGALLIEYLAVIYAWTGEKDRAVEELALAARIPSDVSYGQLSLHPYWDPLRGDPRFDKIVASLAPK